MSTILPPTVTPLTAGSGPATVPVLTVAAADPILQILTDGALVDVVLVGQPGKSSLQVMSSNGLLDLKMMAGGLPPLPDGANLALKFVLGQAGPQFRLLAVNGRALPGVVFPPTAQAGAMGANPLGPLARGGVTAPFISAQNPAMALATAMAPNVGLAAMMIRSASLSAPASTIPGSPAGMTAPAASSSAQSTMAQPSGPVQVQSPTQTALPLNLPAGTRLTIRLLDVAPPGSDPAWNGESGLIVPPSPAGVTEIAAKPLAVLSGHVVAKPPSGAAVVQTEIGTLSVPADDRIQVGGQIRFEVVDQPQLPPPPPAPDPRPSGLGDHGWPALSDALQHLSPASQVPEAAQFLRLLPQMGPTLLTGLAMFVNASQRDEKRREAIAGLEKALEKKGRRDLAEQIDDDLDQVADAARQPRGDGDWRMLTLPLISQQVVEPIRLYIRERQSGGGGAPTADRPEQRFVLDFSFSRVGRLQLDGLVRRTEKHFDLIIRTQEPLVAWARHDIMTIFQDASDLFAIRGSIAFQPGGKWIEPGLTTPAHTEIMA